MALCTHIVVLYAVQRFHYVINSIILQMATAGTGSVSFAMHMKARSRDITVLSFSQ